MNAPALPRIVATKTVHRGWNRLDIVTVEAADRSGRAVRHDREVVDHGEAAVVLAIDPSRDIAILVRQWRAPLIVVGAAAYLLEACAGIVEAGETPEQAARREAGEEIGYRIDALRKIGTIYPSAGMLTEQMHLFVAHVSAEDRVGVGGGNSHEGEAIEVVEFPLDDLFGMARRGSIVDAKTLILVQHLLLERLTAQAATDRS